MWVRERQGPPGLRSAMISPRSFIYSRHPHPRSRTSSPSSSSPPSSTISPSSPSSSSKIHTRVYNYYRSRGRPLDTIPDKPTDTVPRRINAPNYDQNKPHANISIVPIRPTSPPKSPTATDTTKMGKRKERLDGAGLAPSSPPREAATVVTRPTTPSSPVQIPRSRDRPTAHPQKRRTSQRRNPQHGQSPDDISPSMAALLAMTDIPRQRRSGSQRRRPRSDKPLTVDDVFDGQHGSEKELSWNLSKSPMDVLLSPPEEFADDDVSVSDCNIGSALSTRTISAESIPSLGDSFVTDGVSSLGTPFSPSPSFRGRRGPSPMRRSLEPVLSPPGEEEEHPLAHKYDVAVEPAQQPTPPATPEEEPLSLLLGQFKPLKYAFRSNLTASFRALRSAARSFSTINFSTIPSEDLLARSLLTIETNVPYTDERRPPASEDVPSAEMRRYLNPTSTSRVESQLATTPSPGTFSASIQMQTYKVQRSKLSSARAQHPRSLPQSPPPTPPASEPQTAHSMPPGMRQREMRENSDFIRIAVMEMAMRKRGKLDDQRPGRAKWALPPRRTSSAPYEIGPNGVPDRWRSISY